MAKKQTNPPVEKAQVKPAATPKEVSTTQLAFGRENYILMAIGMVVIIIGFILMSGKEDIFSFTKITVAPILVIAGFVIEVFAIIRKSKD